MRLSPPSILGSRLEEPKRTMLARSRRLVCQASVRPLQLVSRVSPQRSRPWSASIRLSPVPTGFQNAVVRIHSNSERPLSITGNLLLLSLPLVLSVLLPSRHRLLWHIPIRLFGKDSRENRRFVSSCTAMPVQTSRDLCTTIWPSLVEKSGYS